MPIYWITDKPSAIKVIQVELDTCKTLIRISLKEDARPGLLSPMAGIYLTAKRGIEFERWLAHPTDKIEGDVSDSNVLWTLATCGLIECPGGEPIRVKVQPDWRYQYGLDDATPALADIVF